MERLRAIRIFLCVVEQGSLLKASRVLRLTPSAVSKSLAALERELETRLLHRSTAGVHATAEGMRFFERCVRVCAELDDAERELRAASLVIHGRLRVNVHEDLGRARLLPALPTFLARHPGLAVDVDLTRQPRSAVADGYDAVVFIGDPSPSTAIAHKMATLHFTTAASPRYVAANGVPREPGDLERHRTLLYLRPDQRPYDEWSFRREGTVEKVRVSGALCINDGHALIQAAIADGGIVHVLHSTAQSAIERGTLIPLLQDWYSDGPPVYVLHPRLRPMPARLAAFLRLVESLFDGRERMPLVYAPAWTVPKG
jgi:DNA-binding transcriptional LysR family regulator